MDTRGHLQQVLEERLKEIAQIVRMGRVTQKWGHSEELLQGAECRTMGRVDRIRVASPFRKRRQHDHPDGTTTRFRETRPFSLIPGDEDDAPVQLSPCFTGSMIGAQRSCMSWHKSGVMRVVACH
jgi:hypothetical protein